MKWIRMFAIGFLVWATIGAAIVYAQGLGGLTPETNMRFVRVDFRDVDRSSGFFVGRIDMGDGTACYAATNVQLVTTLDSLEQLVGLGCVRE